MRFLIALFLFTAAIGGVVMYVANEHPDVLDDWSDAGDSGDEPIADSPETTITTTSASTEEQPVEEEQADNATSSTTTTLPTTTSEPDRDNDNVVDAQDQCPSEDGQGAPSGCADEDNDGLAWGEDECPTEHRRGSPSGCPDPDADGVVYEDDLCRGVAGLPASRGCPAPVALRASIVDLYQADNKCFVKVEVQNNNDFPAVGFVVELSATYWENSPTSIVGTVEIDGSDPIEPGVSRSYSHNFGMTYTQRTEVIDVRGSVVVDGRRVVSFGGPTTC